MKGTKEPVLYKSLSIPEPLFNEFKKHVDNSSNYRNMAEFLREAIREQIKRDKLSALEIVSSVLETISDGKIISEIRDIKSHKKPDTIGLEALEKEITEYREAKQKQKEEWDKNILEYQYIHDTPQSVKDTKKRMKQSYKRKKRELPIWLQDENEFEDMFAERIEKAVTKILKKKDKKGIIGNGHGLD